MLKNLGIVQACFHSSRFRCNATRKLGGRCLFEWVIRRVTDAMRLDGVIVVACETEDCRALSRLVPSDVPIFFGEGNDALARFAKALEQYPAEGGGARPGRQLVHRPGAHRPAGDHGRGPSELRLRELLFARRPAGHPLAGERVCRMVPRRALRKADRWPAASSIAST